MLLTVSKKLGSECSKDLEACAEAKREKAQVQARFLLRLSKYAPKRGHAEPKRYRVGGTMLIKEMEIYALGSLVDSGWMLLDGWRHRARKRGNARACIHREARECDVANAPTGHLHLNMTEQIVGAHDQTLLRVMEHDANFTSGDRAKERRRQLSLILLVEGLGGNEDEDEVFGSSGPKFAPGRKKSGCCKKKCVEFFNIHISSGMCTSGMV
ncbi:hypothetical protein EV424DRAFT_1342885 [Suillus variegatus]|nr:hypothetical protein EV424DRAFT_1342885 [Suillus variegatus]